MDAAWLVRMRWRRRGAWLWPVFVLATVVEAVVGHSFPLAGESQTLFGAALVGCVLNLLGVVLLSRPLGALLRRRCPDLPRLVARDYAGTVTVASIAVLLLLAGVIHRPAVLAHQRARQDAISRAQAFIGDRAPAEFRRNLHLVSTVTIEPGSMYRVCVPSAGRPRTYCVVVKTRIPFPAGVRFDGYESNAVFAAGTN